MVYKQGFVYKHELYVTTNISAIYKILIFYIEIIFLSLCIYLD
ncbi:hypothetical protein SAMN05421780_107182 [Flexibacter flexilis DSM 6793]|uniref:Uncharacterized protein n=1 Tax=Flexibacter flexilis DSM 6793 TaxID=927664 RepID=A0A1I1KRU2_9BACT|nr:hypothetical protein SAMN05421780_107182 [Flexibacter flexilis DSM 6793]